MNGGVRPSQWRLDGGTWNSTGKTSLKQTFSGSGNHTFEVRYQDNDGQWSKPLVGNVSIVVIEKSKTAPAFEACVSAGISTAIYDFYNGKGVPGAPSLVKTKLGLSTDLTAGMTVGRNFRFYGLVSYSLENKKETIIPDAFLVHYFQLGGGCDFLVPFSDSIRLFAGLTGTYSFDVNGGYWSPSVFAGARLGLEFFVSDNLFIGLKSAVRVAHNKASDPLYSSYSYLIDPIGVSAGVRY